MTTQCPTAIQWTDITVGLTSYCISSTVVILGMLFGNEFVPFPRDGLPGGAILESFFQYDALHYKSICESGYHYNPSQRSEVAFFPVYPLLARMVMMAAKCRVEWALLIVANLALAMAFIGLHAYTRQRFTEQASVGLSWQVLLAFGILPTTFFFRMPYSESVFLAVGICTLIAMERRQSALCAALLVGLTTATRPVGAAFVPVFILYWWQQSGNWRRFVAHSVYLAPVACWGLLAYMAYQYATFGDALAFAKTQQFWRVHPDAPFEEKAWSLIVLEPVWGMFVSSSTRYWVNHNDQIQPIFNLVAANPIYFVLSALLIALGAARRWLNGREVLLGAGLVLIPYMTRGYDNSMLSMGRFAAANLPAYLVVGHLLKRLPTGMTGLFAAISAFMLGAYAALFASGYPVF